MREAPYSPRKIPPVGRCTRSLHPDHRDREVRVSGKERRRLIREGSLCCSVAQSNKVTASGERLSDLLVSVGRLLHPLRPRPLRQTDSGSFPSELPHIVDRELASAASPRTCRLWAAPYGEMLLSVPWVSCPPGGQPSVTC